MDMHARKKAQSLQQLWGKTSNNFCGQVSHIVNKNETHWFLSSIQEIKWWHKHPLDWQKNMLVLKVVVAILEVQALVTSTKLFHDVSCESNYMHNVINSLGIASDQDDLIIDQN